MASIDYDLENELALQKMKEAHALRASRVVSPTVRDEGMSLSMPNWQGVANRFMEQTQGNRMEDQAIARQRDLAQQQQGEVDTYNKAISTPGTKSQLRQGEGALLEPNIDTAPLSPEEENQRQMALSLDASRLPNARKTAAQFIQSGVNFPEKQAQIKAQQDLAREQQAARLQQAKEQAAMLEEGRNQRASDTNTLRMTLASIAASNKASKSTGSQAADGGDGPTGKLQHKGFDDAGNAVSYDTGTGALFVTNPGTGKLQRYMAGAMVPTAQFGKEGAADRKAGAQVDRIDTLLDDVKKNSKAFGTVPAVASTLPNAIGARLTSMTLTEDQRVSRVKVMQEAAQIIHAIYGAALSRGEEARANEWAVSPRDDFETVTSKLRAARAYANEVSKKSGKTPDKSSPPVAPADPAAGYDAEKEARYQAWKAKNGK